MKRPRVTVEHAIQATRIETCGGGTGRTTPGVAVVVDFDLHDHEAALAYLDDVVARVKAQIAEAS